MDQHGYRYKNMYGLIYGTTYLTIKIKCIELDRIFYGPREVAKKLGLKGHSGISQCCLGKRKTAGGYHW